MEVKQKTALNHILVTINFNADRLTYFQSVPHTGRSVSYDIKYQDIPQERKLISIPNRSLYFSIIGTAIILTVALLWLLSYIPSVSNIRTILIWVPVIAVLAARMTKPRYAIVMAQFETKMGKLQIIRDSKYELIMAEIDNPTRKYQRSHQVTLKHSKTHEKA